MDESLQQLMRRKILTTLAGSTTTANLVEDDDAVSLFAQKWGVSSQLVHNPKDYWTVSAIPSADSFYFSASVFGLGRYRSLRKLESYVWAFLDEPRYVYPEDISTVNIEPLASENTEKDEFKSALLFELEREPVEDGVAHTAEVIIQTTLARFPQQAPGWIHNLFDEMLAQGKLSYTSGLLQCIGRVRSYAIKEVGKALVVGGLRQESIEIREAAISVIEQWSGEEMIAILRGHKDPTPWLAEYAEQVIQDLSENP
jgi:hypothetical protein